MSTDVKLHYAINADPFPLEASAPIPEGGQAPGYTTATLVLEATNQTSAAVPLQAISLALPTGDQAADLTPTGEANSISPGPPSGWKVGEQQGGQITFNPTSQNYKLGAHEDLSFNLGNVTINRAQGSVPVVGMMLNSARL